MQFKLFEEKHYIGSQEQTAEHTQEMTQQRTGNLEMQEQNIA
jgi:hypothetical protein